MQFDSLVFTSYGIFTVYASVRFARGLYRFKQQRAKELRRTKN